MPTKSTRSVTFWLLIPSSARLSKTSTPHILPSTSIGTPQSERGNGFPSLSLTQSWLTKVRVAYSAITVLLELSLTSGSLSTKICEFVAQACPTTPSARSASSGARNQVEQLFVVCPDRADGTSHPDHGNLPTFHCQKQSHSLQILQKWTCSKRVTR